jgi:mannose/fructose/N-acetylgalactosamine-specific phosphotransferase system component IIC
MKDTLRKECLEQARNTLYTSTSFYIWLRCLRFWRALIWFAAVVCSTVAANSIVSDFGWPAAVVAGLTLAGVLLPAVIKVLKLDETIGFCRKFW